MSLSWPPKDPAETLDYDIDWSQRLLTGDTIVSSSWAAMASGSSLTINSNSFTTTLTKIWLSGGVLGQKYRLTNTVVTANGDTMVESVSILIKAK